MFCLIKVSQRRADLENFLLSESGNDSVRECKNIEEEAVTASGGVITAHYGTSVDSAAFMEKC